MSDIVFKINNIFSTDSRNGALGKNLVSRFLIPPYQRGYKWKSEGEDAWVKILMEDLLDSFRNDEKEYYLQYITVKKRVFNSENVFELIDGQQRITTLTLLISVISHYLEIDNFVKGKLIYGIRDRTNDFFNTFIFTKISELLLYDSWEQFIENNPDYNEQDIYYLFEACKKIEDLLPKREELDSFNIHIKENVKLILNLIEDNISSEKIFSNLNSNKVELTNAELIKGLLLTRVGKERVLENSDSRYYKELIEVRALIGRQWDEVSHWVNRDDIKSFYFGNSSFPIESFLTIIAKQDEKYEKSYTGKYDLFNYFQAQIKRGNKTASYYFDTFISTFLILKDWYNKNEIYNTLGFLFFSKNNIQKDFIKGYLKKNDNELLEGLRIKAVEIVPDDIASLDYTTNKNNIHNVLLALSIFNQEDSFRFDFFSFNKNRWSLEHIFPQNPDKLPDKLEKNDILLINKLIKDEKSIVIEELLKEEETERDIEHLLAKLYKKLEKNHCTLSCREKEILYKIMRVEKLNKIGNMALLTRSDNSSNSNGMFDYKRINIVERVSNGSFVPKHTYDVFSKLLSEDFDSDLKIWSENDIEVHNSYILDRINKIKKSIKL